MRDDTKNGCVADQCIAEFDDVLNQRHDIQQKRNQDNKQDIHEELIQ